MSKITLEPNDSGAGTFSIVSPDSNTNRTLTLPDESGILFSDGSGVPGSAVTGQLASSNMPAGCVIQVVNTIKTDTFSVSLSSRSVSSAIPGFSASITPTSASSKILLMASINGGSPAIVQGFILTRNGSIVTEATGDAAGSRRRVTSGSFPTGSAGALQVPVTYLDAPNTTSQITYEFLIANGANSTQPHYINRSDQDTDAASRFRATSTITVMEIAV